MAFADQLDIAPRTKGRGVKPLTVELVRELGQSDLALLASERHTTPPLIVRLRERHHALARCLAQGLKDAECSAITGYDPSRISILKRDPSFQKLVEDYRSIEAGLAADFTERAALLSLTAMGNLQDRLEDDANPLPASMELEIAKTFADRTGHAPVQKSVNMNVNAELGTRLNAARKRLEGAQAVITSVETVTSEAEGLVGGPDAQPDS